jgi:hypothetical protein
VASMQVVRVELWIRLLLTHWFRVRPPGAPPAKTCHLDGQAWHGLYALSLVMCCHGHGPEQLHSATTRRRVPGESAVGIPARSQEHQPGRIGQLDESGGLARIVHLGDAAGPRGRSSVWGMRGRPAGLAGWPVVSSSTAAGGQLIARIWRGWTRSWDADAGDSGLTLHIQTTVERSRWGVTYRKQGMTNMNTALDITARFDRK